MSSKSFQEKPRVRVKSLKLPFAAASDLQQPTPADAIRIAAIRKIMKKSRTGAELLDWADANGVRIFLDHAMSPSIHGLFHSVGNVVILNARLSDAALVPTLSHELRHGWQYMKGMLSRSFKTTPDDFIVINRLIEADAWAYGTQVAGELSLRGVSEPWQQSCQTPGYQRIMERAIQSYDQNRSNVRNGKTLLAAFNGWFHDVALWQQYDARSLNSYMKRFSDAEERSAFASESSLIDFFDKEGKAKVPQLPPTYGLDFRNKQELLSLFTTPGGGRYLRKISDDYLDNGAFSVSFSERNVTYKDAWREFRNYHSAKPGA